MREIISNILEKQEVNDKAYAISYIDITDFTFIRRIFMEEWIGDKMRTSAISLDEDMHVAFSTITSNLKGSSESYYNKEINDLNEDEKNICKELIGMLDLLIIKNNFSKEAVKVFQLIKNSYLNANKEKEMKR